MAYVGSGILCGQLFEFLRIHAGTARYDTFFLALLGYSAQFVVGFVWLLSTGSWRRRDTEWTRRMVAALLASALFDGSAQGLNYVAQVQGGLMLFTIFNSSVTLFACVFAVAFFGARLHTLQWVGVCSIVVGLLLTSIPNPLVAEHSFFWGLTCSMAGSLCASLSYPISEQVHIARLRSKGR